MDIKAICTDVNNYLASKGAWDRVSVYGDNLLGCEIHMGDWKHNHIALDYFVAEYFNNSDKYEITDAYRENYEESLEDAYSEDHFWVIGEKSATNESFEMATAGGADGDEIKAMRDEQADLEARRAARKERYAIMHKVFDKYMEENETASWINRLYDLVEEAEEIKVVNDPRKVPNQTDDGQKVKYRFSIEDVDIFTDAYNDFVWFVQGDLSESLIHMRSEDEFNAIAMAKNLQVGDIIWYQDKKMTITDTNPVGRYSVELTMVSDDDVEETTIVGINELFERSEAGEIEIELNESAKLSEADYYLSTVEDLEANMFGNMNDLEFDSEDAKFRQIARELGCSDYLKMTVISMSTDYDPAWCDACDRLPITNRRLKGVEKYLCDTCIIIHEIKHDTSFIFCKSEEDANIYLSLICEEF